MKQLILILACLAVFVAHLNVLPVNIMEARNFITAREMVSDGHWIHTTLNGEPRYEKPPLPTWLTAFSMMVFPMDNLYALRLPAAGMALMAIWFVFRLSRRLAPTDRPFAFIAALIACTSFHIVFSGRDGQWDIFTHAFMMGCIYCLFRLLTQNKRHFLYALLGGLLFGCSFLSKGPVSPYALFLPFLIAFGFTYRYKNLKKRGVPLIAFILVALVISGSWWSYIYLSDTTAVSETVGKESGNWLSYEVRPFYYYWSFVVQSGIWTIPAFVGLLYPYLKKRLPQEQQKAYLFTLLWTLTAVVLLSLIPEKKSRYLMPVLFPLAISTAFYIGHLIRNFSTMSIRERLVPYFHFGLVALIGCAFPFVARYYFGEQLHPVVPWYVLTSAGLAGSGLAIFYFLYRRKMTLVFYLTIGFVACITCFGIPMAKAVAVNEQYAPPSSLPGHGDRLFEFRSFSPEIVWDYGQTIPVLKNGSSYRIPEEKSFYVLVQPGFEETFHRTFKNHQVKETGFVDINPVGPDKQGYKSRLTRKVYLIEE